jgi:hypothetical protein
MATSAETRDLTDVSTECVAYGQMTHDWLLVSDLMGGTKAMRKAAARWLPQEPREELGAYLVRLNRSTFYNAYKRAVKSLAGRPFSKPITYSDRLDKRLQDFLLDADLNGRHMDVFLRDVFIHALADGMRHVLIDKAPKPETEKTAADAQKNNRRPYCVEIDPRNVTYWDFTYVNGMPRLTQLRVREQITVPNGKWGQKCYQQYRVFRVDINAGTNYTWEVWRRQEDVADSSGNADADSMKWVLAENGEGGLPFIPLITIYTGRTGFMISEPPLLDLAWENVHHWQSRSDQNHILHIARVPVWFGRGLPTVSSDGVKISYTVSPNQMITSNNDQADMKIIEHTGAAIEAGRKDLEDCENRMAVLGTELLANKTSGTALKTATEIDVDAQAQYSDLAMMVRGLQDAAEKIIEYMGAWEDTDVPDDEYVDINKEFGLAGHIELLTLLQTSRAVGDISQYTLLHEMKRLGALAPSVSIEEEMNRTQSEAPNLGAPGLPNADPNAGIDLEDPADATARSRTPGGGSGGSNGSGSKAGSGSTRKSPNERMAAAGAGGGSK